MKNIIKVTIFALLCAGQSSGMIPPGALPPVAGAVVPQTPDAQAIALINNLGGIVLNTGTPGAPLTATQLDAVAAHVGTLKRVTGTLAGHLEQQDSALVKVGRWLNKHKFKLLAGTVTAATLAGIIYYLYLHWDDQELVNNKITEIQQSINSLAKIKEEAHASINAILDPLKQKLKETTEELEETQELLKEAERQRTFLAGKFWGDMNTALKRQTQLDIKDPKSPHHDIFKYSNLNNTLQEKCSGLANSIKNIFSSARRQECQSANQEAHTLKTSDAFKKLLETFKNKEPNWRKHFDLLRDEISELQTKLTSVHTLTKELKMQEAIKNLLQTKATLADEIAHVTKKLSGNESILGITEQAIKQKIEALEYAEHIALNQVPQQWAPWVRTKLTEIIASEKFKPLTKTAAFLPPLAYAGFNRLASGSWFTPGANYARKGAVVAGNIAYSAAVTYLAYLMTQAAGGA